MKVGLFHTGGFGAAQTMSIWVEDIRKAGAVAIMVDNSGVVWGFRNGCSRDAYIYTLAKLYPGMQYNRVERSIKLLICRTWV